MRSLFQHLIFRERYSKYVLAVVLFSIWMLFLDSSSWRVHRELDTEIERLEASMEYYNAQIDRDQAVIHALDTSKEALEKWAREEYWMHRPDEDVFIFNLD